MFGSDDNKNNNDADIESMKSLKQRDDDEEEELNGEKYDSIETTLNHDSNRTRTRRRRRRKKKNGGFTRRTLFVILALALLLLSIFVALRPRHSKIGFVSPTEEEEEDREKNNVDGAGQTTEGGGGEDEVKVIVPTLSPTISSLLPTSSSPTSSTTTTSFSPPKHESYNILSTDYIQERNANMILYQHKKTHTQFVAYIPDTTTTTKTTTIQDDKVFGISFRTKPTSSNGAPHILEHSVLCGSTLYPAKDPFLYLLKSSLHTFLNAMTYDDRTVYPISSRNGMDFKNLMMVYVDAVFRPLVVEDGDDGGGGRSGEWILRQEGWRLEPVLEKGDDDEDGGESSGDGELEYKGVVYSEMKGVYSDPESLLYQTSQTHLYPDTSFRFDAGGEPRIIPTLTYEEFKSFYHEHYHPSNAQVFVSGTVDDVFFVLDYIDGEYLADYDDEEEEDGVVKDVRSETEIGLQPWVFHEPVRTTVPYAASNVDEGSMMMITWLLSSQPFSRKNYDEDDVEGRMMELAWSVLDHLLVGTSSSILCKTLMDSGLGESVLDDGLTDIFQQFTFGIGMKGILGNGTVLGGGNETVGGVKEVEDLIMKTLENIADEGFLEEDIEASLNAVDFELREFDSGSDPKGISIFLTILSKWNYDFHPKTALQFQTAFSQLKDHIQQSQSSLFQSMIRNHLLTNTHRVIVELVPSTTLEQEQILQEKNRLSTLRKSLTPAEYETILQDSQTLKNIQSTPDPPSVIATIPTLSLSDVDKSSMEYPIEIMNDAYGSGVTVLRHEVSSSHNIVHVNFVLDISSIEYEDIPLLKLLCRLFTETGTDALSDVQFDRFINLHTGGIDVSYLLQPVKPSKQTTQTTQTTTTTIPDGTNFVSKLIISTKSITSKSSLLFTIIHLTLSKSKLTTDRSKIQRILRDMISELKSDIIDSGHSMVVRRIKSRYSPLELLNEQLEGVSSLKNLEFIFNQTLEDWDGLSQRLENMRQLMLNGQYRDGMILDITGDVSVLEKVQSSMETFLTDTLPRMATTTTSSNVTTTQQQQQQQQSLPNFASQTHPWYQQAKLDLTKIQNEAIVTSTLVSFIGKGGILYDETFTINGSVDVISRYLQNGYLWQKLRVENGAYGAMDYFTYKEGGGGIFIMVSYRDPNVIHHTLDIFNNASNAILHDSTFIKEESSLTQAIIGAIGHLDGKTLSPNDLGMVSLKRFLSGETKDDRQRWRDDMFSTTVDHFKDFGMRLVRWKDESTVAVVTSRGMVDQEDDAHNLTVVVTV